jgi:hypothetical protein
MQYMSLMASQLCCNLQAIVTHQASSSYKLLYAMLACVQVVYGADKQAWGNIRSALRKGEPKDGPVTLVLERRVVNSS